MDSTGKDLVYEEVKDDQTVPEGWKSAVCHDRKFSKVFWDSEMRFYSSRVEAVKVMVGDKNNYTPREIEMMKKGLESDGWGKHIGLPEGWMYRGLQICVTFWEEEFTEHQFLSPEFEIVSDHSSVLKTLVSGNFKSESVFSKFVLNFCLGISKDQIESFEWIQGV